MDTEETRHKTWERDQHRNPTDVAEGYEAARRAFELGMAIRARRESLGLTQAEVAKRAGMTQSALSRLEAGGSGTPTIGVLERLAKALEADLVVRLQPHAA